MLSQPQSIQIVVGCIRATSGVPEVAVGGTLDDAGIRTETLLGLISRIVNSAEIGVPSQNHRVAVGFFQNIDTDARVLEVVDIVRTRSAPVLG
jgi:hypothetical protein